MSSGPPIRLPPNFVEVWNSSQSAVACAATLGIPIDHAWCLQQRLKKQGVTLKKFPRNWPKFDHSKFALAWNAARSVREFAAQQGISVDLARDRARRVRKAGHKLERMVTRVDVYGVALTVKEICALTGRSKSTVSALLADGKSPLRIAPLT